MNEQRSKKILFNKSSLLSLKAELLKKQEEVQDKKHLPQHNIDGYKPPVAAKTSKKDKQEKRTFKDNLRAVDTDELEACRKSKLALEKKAELYAHLSDGAGKSELSGRFLVDFDNKKQQAPELSAQPEVKKDSDTEIDHSYEDDEGEWTEFTDCLGRTRKCLKSDLELYMKRDQVLMRATTNDPEQPPDDPPETEPPPAAKPLLVQKTNDYLQSLREKWERQEQAVLAKEKDIHYQDLLYDEARIHGVSYFSFSTDEAERQKQMAALKKQREATLAAQREAEDRRRKRDELVAARVAAARARQRARAGLPPEEPKNENEKDFTTCLLEFLTQQKNEAENKAKEEEKKLKEEREKERQKLREEYVRDWDIGKEGVEGKVKKFREMTQEEYVEQQRSKRIDEFAPIQGSSRGNSNFTFDDKGKIVSTSSKSDSPPRTKTWADVRPKVKTPPPPIISFVESEQKGLYFSSSKSLTKPNMQYRNFIKAQESTPIDNEISDDEREEEKRFEGRQSDPNHTEIAPPPTYDYYGPVPKKAKHQKPFDSDIREAYDQGARSLEPKTSREKLPRHYDFTFD